MKKSLLFILISFLFLPNLFSQHQDYKSPYAGEEKRAIKSLSDSDIEALLNGKGWGFAKVAELNGVPGPMHILEMKEDISLTAKQEERITEIYNKMKSKAVELGEEYVSLEKELNKLFKERKINAKSLRYYVPRIGSIRSQLRFVHLNAHLEALPILTEAQVQKYNELRGYGSGDPCKNIPEGHNPEMWKKHNNCN